MSFLGNSHICGGTHCHMPPCLPQKQVSPWPPHTISTVQGILCLFFLRSVLVPLFTVCPWNGPGAHSSLERCTQVSLAVVSLLCNTDLPSHIKAFNQQLFSIVNEEGFHVGWWLHHTALWVLDSIWHPICIENASCHHPSIVQKSWILAFYLTKKVWLIQTQQHEHLNRLPPLRFSTRVFVESYYNLDKCLLLSPSL